MTSAEEASPAGSGVQALQKFYPFPGTTFLGKCLTISQRFHVRFVADETLVRGEDFCINRNTGTVRLPTWYTPSEQRRALLQIVGSLVFDSDSVYGFDSTQRPWLIASNGKLVDPHE
jgi:hypothetical protein